MKSKWDDISDASLKPVEEGKNVEHCPTPRALRFLPSGGSSGRPYGEAFESFYRKEILGQKDAQTFQHIAEEPILPLDAQDLLDLVPEANIPILEHRAKELAEQIFLLTNRHWQQSSNIYLKKLDEALRGLCAAESRFLLDHMRAIFRERFGEEIQQKGESAEPLDQIVNRAGKHSEQKFAKILQGFSPLHHAREIWDRHDGTGNISGRTLGDELERLTEYELRELRTEFAALPDIILAEELHKLLPSRADAPSKEKKPDKEAEQEEDTQNLEFRIGGLDVRIRGFLRLHEIQLLLRGKRADEIARAEFQHNARFAEEHGSLRERVQLLPLDSEKTAVEKLLLGFQAGSIVGEIHKRLHTPDWWKSSEMHGMLLDEVLPSNVHGLLPIRAQHQGILPKRTFFAQEQHIALQTLEAKRSLDDIFSCLRERERQEVMALLEEPLQDALRTYLSVQEPFLFRYQEFFVTLDTASNLRDLLRPLLFFTQKELVLVQESFFQFTGQHLEDVLRGRLGDIFQETPGAFARDILARRLQGLYALDEFPDLFKLTQAAHEDERLRESTPYRQKMKESALAIITILGKPQSHETAHAIGRHYLGLDAFEHLLLDDACFYFHPEKLRLGELLNDSQKAVFFSYRAGFELQQSLPALRKNPEQFLLQHRSAPVYFLQALDQELREQGEGLIHLLKEHGSCELSAYLPASTPRAFTFAKLFRNLQAGMKNAKKEIQSFLHGLQEPFLLASSFEQAFDQRFGRFREILKYLGGKRRLQPELLAHSFFYLEGLDPALLEQIHILVDSSKTSKLQNLFRELHVENKSIEETYDILYAETPLRASIDACAAPLPSRCKTILLLMGYDPDKEAKDILEILDKTAGNVCVDRIRRLLSPGTEQNPNEHIPSDVNWVLEMYTQIRESFIQITGSSLLIRIAERQVSKQKFREIAEFLHGDQATEGAVQLFALTLGSENPDELATDLIEFLGKKNPRLRQTILDLFNEYYPALGVCEPLANILDALSISAPLRKKVVKVLGEEEKEGTADC